MLMEITDETPLQGIPTPPPVGDDPDFFAWHKQNFVFEDADIEQEVARQVVLLAKGNSAKESQLTAQMKAPGTREAVKAAISESAYLFSAAMTLGDEPTFQSFSRKLLDASKGNEPLVIQVRLSLLTEEPSDARVAIEKLMATQEGMEGRALRMAQNRYNTRLDVFTDQFRKQHAV